MNYYITDFSRILILLSSSGISSAVERSILAITQQRQSPANLTIFGFTIFICDGIKLFSKNITSLFISYYALFTIIFLYISILFIEFQFEITRIISIIVIQINAWMLLALFEFISLTILLTIQTTYINIAINRNIEVLILSELVWSFLLIILIILHNITRVSSLLYYINILLIISVVWFPLLLNFDKVPFDVIEAESELIDGITTEYEGFVFSLIYAAEAILVFLSLKIFIIYSGFIIIIVFLIIILIYFGRAFLARFLISDIIELMLSIGLLISILILLIVYKIILNNQDNSSWYYCISILFYNIYK